MTLERLQELAVSNVLQVFIAQMMVWDHRMLNLLTVHPDTIARKERQTTPRNAPMAITVQ
jgi:hypothetical protein